jgi:FkbH-like protein
MVKSEKVIMNADINGCQTTDNIFLCVYMNDFVKKFRILNKDYLEISISGLTKFIPKNDNSSTWLIEQLKENNFSIKFGDWIEESINEIYITCENKTKNVNFNFKYQIQNLPYLVDISSKTNISVFGIILTKIIAQIIIKIRILYKAIILDLDETLWMGTISEDGIDRIKENMITRIGAPYIEFMKFVKILGDELGIYIAICSRNDIKLIESTINNLDNCIFPLKNHIDCIIANHNDKSENIKIIAEQLSILPDSIVFIDDNQIIRDEVKNKLPGVFVPNWKNHNELVSQLIAGCIFDRIELSLNSQNRRKQYKILQAERKQNSLPELLIKVNDDLEHIQAQELYSKSNQFKLVSEQIDYSDTKSLYFEVYRQNRENLGVCSAITYSLLNNSKCVILNWAISCRYFEVGLEELIILFLIENMTNKEVYFACQYNEENKKVQEFINKYYGEIISDSVSTDSDIFINHFNDDYHFVKLLTNLRNSEKQFNVYWINNHSPNKDLLIKNTNLKLL